MHGLDDFPSLEDFGGQLDRLAARDGRRVAWWRRPPGTSMLLAAVLGLGLTGTAAAATLVALRATLVPGPQAAAVAPEMRVRAGTELVSSLRAPDPGDAPAWTLRSVRSVTGELCLTVGQVRNEGFGLVGLDGRFRTLAPSIVDGCTETGGKGVQLAGARVLDGASRREVRTVLYGLAGSDIRRVEVRTGQITRRLPLDRGRFLTVVAGYPEDRPLDLITTTATGVERQRFGASPRVQPQTDGIPALKLNGYIVDNARDTVCVGVGPARQTDPPEGQGGSACGRKGRPFAVVRRVKRGKDGWGTLPSRTLVFGSWPPGGPRLRSVRVHAAGRTVSARLLPGRGFLVALPPSAPARTRVTVTDRTGHRTTFTKSLGLVKDPLG